MTNYEKRGHKKLLLMSIHFISRTCWKWNNCYISVLIAISYWTYTEERYYCLSRTLQLRVRSHSFSHIPSRKVQTFVTFFVWRTGCTSSLLHYCTEKYTLQSKFLVIFSEWNTCVWRTIFSTVAKKFTQIFGYNCRLYTKIYCFKVTPILSLSLKKNRWNWKDLKPRFLCSLSLFKLRITQFYSGK